MKKKSKAPIIILVLTFLVLAASVANLVYCLSNPNFSENIPMAIGIAVIMLGIFIACLITAIKDMKKAKASDDDLDDDDDEDDDEE